VNYLLLNILIQIENIAALSIFSPEIPK